jgi:hypothetical protein
VLFWEKSKLTGMHCRVSGAHRLREPDFLIAGESGKRAERMRPNLEHALSMCAKSGHPVIRKGRGSGVYRAEIR